ncbi:radical SAM protein [Desulfovibrio sp. OttesenSCG-928-G11]|nr:radical SAM protein [Desulfovibrio sp. OttesenSCG-928-G11]
MPNPIRCYMPWQQMVVDATSGVVVPCCFWRSEPCGDVRKSSLLEIWNGTSFQKLRKAMFAGDLRAAGCAECYAIKQKAKLSFYFDPAAKEEKAPLSAYAENLERLEREIEQGKTILSALPTILSMTLTHKCNIRCLHCYQEKTRDLPLSRESIYDETLALTSTLGQLVLGGGEPFADPHWRRFFKEWQADVNPYLHIGLTTNATLVNEEILTALDQFRHLTISVSFDAGSREVYEKIRYGANFDAVLENIEKLKALVRKRELPSSCGLTMCVMKSNIHDLKNYLQLSHDLLIAAGFFPVSFFPAHETLTVFNNAAQETQNWKQIFTEAREMLTDDFLRPVYEAGKDTIKSHFKEAYVPFLDAVENSIPWQSVALPAFQVKGQLPPAIWQKFSHLRAPKGGGIRDAYHKNPVLALFPMREGGKIWRYYADIQEDGSWTAHLPEDRYRFGIIRPMDGPDIYNPDIHLVVQKNADGAASVSFSKKLVPSLERVKRALPQPIRRVLKKIWHRLR